MKAIIINKTSKETYPISNESYNASVCLMKQIGSYLTITKNKFMQRYAWTENKLSKKERRVDALVQPGVRTAESIFKDSRKVLGKPAEEGESPVHEVWEELAVSRVHRDTRNLDGMSGDHSVRLNTT